MTKIRSDRQLEVELHSECPICRADNLIATAFVKEHTTRELLVEVMCHNCNWNNLVDVDFEEQIKDRLSL